MNYAAVNHASSLLQRSADLGALRKVVRICSKMEQRAFSHRCWQRIYSCLRLALGNYHITNWLHLLGCSCLNPGGWVILEFFLSWRHQFVMLSDSKMMQPCFLLSEVITHCAFMSVPPHIVTIIYFVGVNWIRRLQRCFRFDIVNEWGAAIQSSPLTLTPLGQEKSVTLSKCHSNHLVYKRPFGTCLNCHCKRGVTVTSVTVSGEICISQWLEAKREG